MIERLVGGTCIIAMISAGIHYRRVCSAARVRRRVGPVRLFAEVRYHRVTSRFDEVSNADTFVPISFGITLGR